MNPHETGARARKAHALLNVFDAAAPGRRITAYALGKLTDAAAAPVPCILLGGGYVLNTKGRARRFRSPLHALCWADCNGYEVAS